MSLGESGNLLLTSSVAIPLVAGLFLLLWRQASATLARRLDLSSNLIVLLFILGMYPLVEAESVWTVSFPTVLPPFGLSLRVDVFSFLIAATIGAVWSLVTWFSNAYIDDRHLRRYHAFSCLTLGSSLGVVLAGDLFTLFLFFEIMAFTSYVLVIHKQSKPALGAGNQYLYMAIAGGLAFFYGLLGTQQLAGTVSFAQGGTISDTSFLAWTVYLAYLIAFGLKAGMFPLHVWLPEAHPVAPSPASALLSGLMIKTGAYGLIRVVTGVFGVELLADAGWNVILLVLGGISILWGSLLALGQDDLKRRLAYSSVGQIGYILVGIALLNERALVGGIFHIIAHALMKSTLFLAAGVLIHETGKRRIGELSGVGRELPLPMMAFTVSALAMIGIPGFTGFISKWELSMGALAAGQPLIIVLFLLSSFLNCLYYLPVIISAFFGQGEEVTEHHQLPLAIAVPLVILAAASVVLGLFPQNLPLALTQKAASFLIMGM